MPNHLSCGFTFRADNGERRSASNLGFCSLVLIGLFLLPPHLLSAQDEATAAPSASLPVNSAPEATFTTDAAVIPKQTPRTHQAQSEVSVMGMIPDGDYRLFSATVRCTAWTLGVEYDRPFPIGFVGARIDYATEVLPFVLLSQPVISDFWGNGLGPNQQFVPGMAILPIGFRFLWRGTQAVRPYVVGKLGGIFFTRKALSPDASNANFNVQAAFGLQLRLTERIDLRVEPFEFFHVSNGYLTASNPGMDELATRFGVTYHLRKKAQ